MQILNWNGYLKTNDDEIIIECNPARVYLISLLLDQDDTIDVVDYIQTSQWENWRQTKSCPYQMNW
jgi:hypothetical protein